MQPTQIAPLFAGNVAGAPEGSFVVAEWRDSGAPPGPPFLIAPPHIHHEDDEAWYVVEGRLRVRVGDEVVEAGPGSCVFAPRGAVHSYWNPDPTPVRYLLIMSPRIYALIQEIHATADRSKEAMTELFGRYGSELVG